MHHMRGVCSKTHRPGGSLFRAPNARVLQILEVPEAATHQVRVGNADHIRKEHEQTRNRGGTGRTRAHPASTQGRRRGPGRASTGRRIPLPPIKRKRQRRGKCQSKAQCSQEEAGPATGQCGSGGRGKHRRPRTLQAFRSEGAGQPRFDAGPIPKAHARKSRHKQAPARQG